MIVNWDDRKKKKVAFFVALFLSTPATLMMARVSHPQFDIGVVLVDECDEHFANVTIESYKEYDDYFEASLIPVRFNASEVRVKGGNYLNSDFFHLGRPGRLQDTYEVDIIIFLTDHHIENWDGNGRGILGEANPETSSALVSVASFANRTAYHDRVVRHIALHEAFHLLGYTHNHWTDEGIMVYARNTEVDRLNGYNEFQLPLHAWALRLAPGTSFLTIVFISNALFVLACLPFYAAAELGLFRLYKRLHKVAPPRFLIAVGIAEAFIILMTYRESFVFLLVPLIFMVFFHQVYYTWEIVRSGKEENAKSQDQ